jgi:hypothetical protein
MVASNAPDRRKRSPRVSAAPLDGFDIGLAAFALACMTAGFWRLWPGAVALNDAPLGTLILKAGLAALGFVAIATRWEDTMRAFARNPTPLILIALALASALWASAPAEALRNSILLLVVWGFGIALSLRFKTKELAEICAFAGLFGLAAQFAAHNGVPPMGAFDGDLAFALVMCAWAAWVVPARKMLWLFTLGVCAILAFAAGDWASCGGALGFGLGFLLAKVGALNVRKGPISIIITAWFLVALIAGVTVFALFGAQPVSAAISMFYADLGPQMVMGQGFGTSGYSVASAMGAGLGLVGIGAAGLVMFATLFQALLGNRIGNDASLSTIAVWFGSLAAIIMSTGEIGVFSPIFIVLAATSFSISLSCVPPVRTRKPLFEPKQRVAAPMRTVGIARSNPASLDVKPGVVGLRPKI